MVLESIHDQCLQLVDDILEVTGAALPLHDLNHLLADCSDLCALSVRCLLDLMLTTLGETNAEQTQEVSVGGTDIQVGIDHCLLENSDQNTLVK